jgi:hypothetical protein
MNQGNHKQTIFKLSVFSLFFTLCCLSSTSALAAPPCLTPGAAAKFIDIEIGAGLDPVFTFVNACPGSPGVKGAICNSINEKPDVRFIKKGTDKAKWEFIDFQLSSDDVNWPGVLPAGVYSDFQFGSDPRLMTGRPEYKLAGNSMLVQNNNCHEFTVYYRVVLRHVTSNKVVRLHPVFDNKGTN